jgi:hypothetical protein
MKTKKRLKTPKDYHYDNVVSAVRLKPDFHKKVLEAARKEGFNNMGVFIRFLITEFMNSRTQEK